jgi:glycerol-3-phosphate acyltransferase PlsY
VNYLILFCGFIVAYLLGSIPTAVWVGKWFYGIDVRNEGSGNAGATNTIRVLGAKAGIPVVIVDILKGFFAVLLMRFFIPEGTGEDVKIYYEIIAGLLAVVGHALPLFAGFRGGKGVATLLGIGIALFGWAVLFSVAIFLLVVLVTRYVSLGSVLAGIAFPLVVIFYFKVSNPGLVALSVFAALFLLWTHRKNIKRLLSGTENKFSFRKVKGKS